MRKSIFEILNNEENINLEKELQNIASLFSDIYVRHYDYLNGFINTYIIKDWKYAKRCLSIGALRDKLEISVEALHYYKYDLDHSLRYLEFTYNLAMLANDFIHENFLTFQNPEDFERLIRNIKSLLEELNYEIVDVEDRYEIIEKDSKTTYVAESNTEIATDIIEYRKYDLKGDLESKREILQKLAPQVEALRKQFSKTTYKTLMEDTHYLLNNFHIRHNNKDGQYRIEAICNMKDEELEQWYDVTYNNILSVFIIKDYLENKLSIDEIKKIVK